MLLSTLNTIEYCNKCSGYLCRSIPWCSIFQIISYVDFVQGNRSSFIW